MHDKIIILYLLLYIACNIRKLAIRREARGSSCKLEIKKKQRLSALQNKTIYCIIIRKLAISCVPGVVASCDGGGEVAVPANLLRT